MTSSWWRTQQNTEWGAFNVSNPPRTGDNPYQYDDTHRSWSYDWFVQVQNGEDDALLESTLCRLDLQAPPAVDWRFTYMTHPRFQEQAGVSWVVDYSAGGRLAHDLGWNEPGAGMPALDIWGWGLPIRLKDFANGVLKTLVIRRGTGTVMGGITFSAGTILYRGQYDRGGIGFRQEYLARSMGADPGALGRGRKASGNGAGQSGTLPPLSGISDADLEAEQERRRAARPADVQENASLPKDPQHGVRPDGTTPSNPEDATGKDTVRATTAMSKLTVRPDVLEEHGGAGAQKALASAAR